MKMQKEDKEKEFVSELEKIMEAIELNFEPTPAFGQYKQYLEHAVAHPAKMNINLLEFLITNFTREGETILDPMAGSGSTGVVAALHNRNAICIDIESKFYQWMEEARRKVEQTPTLTPKGKIVNICGDARKLSELLSQADTIITSPPYGDTISDDKEGPLAGANEKKYGRWRKGTARKHSYTQLGEPCKTIDAIITSPPYERQHQGGADTPKVRHGCIKEKYPSMENIGNLPHGNIDVIITSPPYADGKKGKVDVERMVERWDEHYKPEWNSWGKTWSTNGRKIGLEALGSGYSESENNIGNLPFGNVDVVITSPPYDESMSEKRHYTPNTGRVERLWREKHLGAYPSSNGQIGALKSLDEEYEALARGLMTRGGKPTYLSEMLKVYREMYKILRPSGRAIIVVKPFIRNKKVVDLPYHTWLLMQKIGFKLEKLYKLRLQTKSFWRILYYQRFPNIPKINHEYILICIKPQK